MYINILVIIEIALDYVLLIKENYCKKAVIDRFVIELREKIVL